MRWGTGGPVHGSESPVDAPADLGDFLYGSAHFADLFVLEKAFQMCKSNYVSVCLGKIVYCNVNIPGRDRKVACGRSRTGVPDVIKANVTDYAINHSLSVREAGLRRQTNLQLSTLASIVRIFFIRCGFCKGMWLSCTLQYSKLSKASKPNCVYNVSSHKWETAVIDMIRNNAIDRDLGQSVGRQHLEVFGTSGNIHSQVQLHLLL